QPRTGHDLGLRGRSRPAVARRGGADRRRVAAAFHARRAVAARGERAVRLGHRAPGGRGERDPRADRRERRGAEPDLPAGLGVTGTDVYGAAAVVAGGALAAARGRGARRVRGAAVGPAGGALGVPAGRRAGPARRRHVARGGPGGAGLSPPAAWGSWL